MKKHNLSLSLPSATRRWFMTLGIFLAMGCAFAQEKQAPTTPIWETNPLELHVSVGFMPSIWPYMYEPNFSYISNTRNTKTYPAFYTPSVNVGFSYKFNKFFTLGAYYSAGMLVKKTVYSYDLTQLMSENLTYHGFTPQVRFDWLNKKYVTMYSSAAIGVAFIHKRATIHGVKYPDSDLRFLADVTLAGIKVGRRWFGMAEVSLSNTGYFKTGIGYRFSCK